MMTAIARQFKIATFSLPLAALIGSAVAFFLWSLELATETRFAHPAIIYGLPFGGLALLALYQYYGGKSSLGNNLVIDEIHEPGGGLPLRMAPLVLFSSVGTHLFGGSAGREGTAVQMGGSLASEYARRLKLSPEITRGLLICGIAAGFGAVFGTPFAGAIFAIEVLSLGRIELAYALPSLAAAYAGHRASLAWGIHHTDYHIGIFAGDMSVSPQWTLLWKTTLAALAFGLVARLFIEGIHRLSALTQKALPQWWTRPLAGGVVVLALVWMLGTTDYLGLGVRSPDPNGVSILSSFHAGGAQSYSWLLKLLFTLITLATGFKGGEVTPLFFIGATLGNALAASLGAPVELFAAMGFVAVFAGATNTPLACTVMALELFGGGAGLYFAAACFIARYVSGDKGIYKAQRR